MGVDEFLDGGFEDVVQRESDEEQEEASSEGMHCIYRTGSSPCYVCTIAFNVFRACTAFLQREQSMAESNFFNLTEQIMRLMTSC